LLVFGQNYSGESIFTVDGLYTQQVRPFKIIDNGHKLAIQPEKQAAPIPSYRRRDLNVVPLITKGPKSYQFSFLALSGIFTETNGIWTVPVFIQPDGTSVMPDPSGSSTFKQGMNNYACAHVELYSKQTNDMYIVLFGGISYGFFDNGDFFTDVELPFINQVTTLKRDAQGNFQHYLMPSEYPTISAEFSNPGNTLLFGAEAQFIPADNLAAFPNGVFSLDRLGSSPVLLGYIVGGIQSTFPNTSTPADSASSPYIFSVYLQRN
jgi:hypothetical protein